MTAQGLLATVVFSASIVPTEVISTAMVGQDLGAQAFHVTAGEHLAIAVTSANDGQEGQYFWVLFSSPGTDYAGGSAFLRQPSGTQFVAGPGDYGFQTFVTVPEPSSLVLACLGLIGLAAWGWRKRKGQTESI